MRLLVAVVVFASIVYQTQGWIVYPCRFHPLGMQNGDVRDNQLSSNSSREVGQGPANARLMQAGGWSAGSDRAGEWIQVDFAEVQILTGIKTQGRSDADEWVTTYYIFFQIALSPVFHKYKDTFQGNTNRSSIQHNVFSRPYLIAIRVRIVVMTWFGWPSMRFELMGCPQNSRIDLLCGVDIMRLRVPRSLLPTNLPAAETHLMDPACKGTEFTDNGITYYQWTSTLNGCNTTCFVTPNYVHYYNLVTNDHNMDGLTIWRRGRLRIPFICSYLMHDLKTTIGLQPNLSVWQWGEHAFGSFICTIRIYRTNAYTEAVAFPISGPPSPVPLNFQVFVELRLTAGDVHLVIKAHTCWATADPNPGSLPQYVLIDSGVAIDPTVQFHTPDPENTKIQRWSFRTFVLLKHHDLIYIHCRCYICKGRTGFCAPTKRKRGMNDEDLPKPTNELSTIATHGPIRLNLDEKAKPKLRKLTHKVLLQEPQSDLPSDVTHKEDLGPNPEKYSLWETL